MPPQVLIVEDDVTAQHLLAAILEAEGAEVHIARDGVAAIEMIEKSDYALILLDIVLPRLSGMGVMEHLRQTKPSALEKVIVVSGVDVAEIRELFPTVRNALSKPVLPGRLRATIRTCMPGLRPADIPALS